MPHSAADLGSDPADPDFPGRVWVFVDTVRSHSMRASCELIDGHWVMVSEVTA